MNREPQEIDASLRPLDSRTILRSPKRSVVQPCTLPLGSTCKLTLWE